MLARSSKSVTINRCRLYVGVFLCPSVLCEHSECTYVHSLLEVCSRFVHVLEMSGNGDETKQALEEERVDGNKKENGQTKQER